MATNPENPPPKPPENDNGGSGGNNEKKKQRDAKFQEGIEDHIRRRSGETNPDLLGNIGEAILKIYKDSDLVEKDEEGNLRLTQKGEQRREVIAKHFSQERDLSIDDETKIIFGDEKEAWGTIQRLLSEIYSNAFMSPNEPFQASMGNLELQMKMVAIKAAALASKDHSRFLSQKMSEMHQAAEVIHNASYIVNTNKGKPEDMMKLMQVPSTVSDVILKMDGVSTTYRLYADYFNQLRMDNLRTKERLDWIGPEDVYFNWKSGKCPIDEEVRKTLILAIESGVFDGKKYDRESPEFKEAWPDSKINQALHYGRSYGAATAVLVEISGETDLPGEKMISPFAEDFTRTFGPIKHLVDKFGIGNVAAYIYYLFTGDMKTFSCDAEIKHYLSQAIDIKKIMAMSKEERDKIPNFIWNLTGIDSRSGGWRLKTAAGWDKLSDKEKKLCGVEVNLKDTRDPDTRKLLKGEKLQKALRTNQEVWDLALRRTPLAVLRALLRVNPELQTDINNVFFESEAKVWFKEGEGEGEKEIVDYQWIKGEKIETKKTLKVKVANEESADKIRSMERWLLILKEDAVRREELELNFDLVSEDLREDVKRYRDTIRKMAWDKGYLGGSFADYDPNNSNRAKREVKREWLVDKDDDMKKIFPHTTTISDMPFETMEYIRAGSIGNLGRRWRDIYGADAAKDGFMGFMGKLPLAQKVSDYEEMLSPIYEAMKDFDKSGAQEFMHYMLEMIGKGNQKLPGYRWLPAGLDLIPSVGGLFPQPKSYAQTIFGDDAACWDKVDIWSMIKKFATRDIINGLGENNAKDRLIDKLKVGPGYRVLEGFVRWGPMVGVFMLWILAEKLFKDLEEEAKEA